MSKESNGIVSKIFAVPRHGSMTKSNFRFVTGSRSRFVRVNLYNTKSAIERLEYDEKQLQRPPASKELCVESYLDFNEWGLWQLNTFKGIIGSYLDYGCVSLLQLGSFLHQTRLFGYVTETHAASLALLEIAGSEGGLEWFDSLGMTRMVPATAAGKPAAADAENEKRGVKRKRVGEGDSQDDGSDRDRDTPGAKRIMLEQGKAATAPSSSSGRAAETETKHAEPEDEDAETKQKLGRLVIDGLSLERLPSAEEMEGPVRVHFDFQNFLLYCFEFTEGSNKVKIKQSRCPKKGRYDDESDRAALIDENRAIGVHTLKWGEQDLHHQVFERPAELRREQESYRMLEALGIVHRVYM